MSAAATIFIRDLRERSRLFIACIVMAAVPFVATLLPSARGHRGDVIAIVGGALAICIGIGTALALGMSVISRDLTERRMSFYFARPLSPAALWIGKAGAALVTLLFCFSVIAVPAMLFAGRAWDRRWLGGMQPILAGALAISVLFFVSHAFATVVRSRSTLLALDFVFAIVCAGALLMIFWPVFLGQAIGVSQVMMIAIAIAVLIILAIAPVWQLAQGRTDIRRSHAAFSRFFWPASAVVLLVAGAYVWWLVSATPRDLDSIRNIEQPARGHFAMITGGSNGRADYQSTFLVDTTNGKYERIATPPWWGIESSKDGKVIAWLQPAGMFSVSFLELYVNGRATNILMSPSARLVMSDDGTRVATDTGTTITVYEVASGKMLASAAGFDSRAQANLFFVTNDLLRVIETEPLRISELDVRNRKLTRTGERDLETPSGHAISVSGDGSRMFVRGPNVIADARTGATIAPVDRDLDPDRYSSASMLHDGRVAAISYAARTPRLRLYAPDGTRTAEIALQPARSVWISGEIEGGRLILTAHRGTMYVIDVARGVIEQRLDGVNGPRPRFSADPRLIVYAADRDLIARKGKDLIVWNANGRAAARPLWR